MLTLDLDPLTAPADRLRAFVAMPYGTKFDPVTRHRIDCDVVFDHVYVPVLEDLDLEWQRADLEADSGIIHVDMIEALARADVVIVDLATQNSNVAYELGLRHALADRMTVLTYPRVAGTRRVQLPPFDLEPIRHVRFDRSFDGLSDRQAADGVRALRRVVETVISTPAVDSPVLAWFEPDDNGRLRRRADMDATAVAHRKARGIAQAAIKSASVERMREAVAQVSTGALREPERRNLLLELGSALLQESAYADARAALAGAEPPPGHPLRMRWLQQTALLESWDAPAAGEDPSPRWERAERLLAEVLREADDAETCGIAAGIVKRRLARALGQGRRELAPAYLDRMVRLYRRGFQAEPGYYAGVNLTAALRLSAQHFGIAVDLGEAREALAVSRFFARRDQADHPDAFWPAVTLAELDLHEALLVGARGTASVADGYRAAAALPAPSRWRGSAAQQLQLFARAGDDEALIGELMRIVGPR
jgi:hypothetical protein